MSATPQQESSASPQKRPQSEEADQPSKRVKTEETQAVPTVDDILEGEFDIDSLGIPGDLPAADDPLLNISLPGSTNTSALNTPSLTNIEIPELPSDPPTIANQQLTSPSGVQTPQPQPQTVVQGSQSSSATTPAPSTTVGTPAPQSQSAAPLKLTNTNTATPQQSTTQTPQNSNTNKAGEGAAPPKGPGDPEKLSDAILAAGVDLKAEEALLNSASLPTKAPSTTDTTSNQPIIINTPFLDPRQAAAFMNKVVAAHGLKANTESDASLVQLVTYASEEWMKNILTNAVVLSRHRRRAIKNKRRSELAVALRDLAVQNKTMEERRNDLKKNAGITGDETEGLEETQHKATNATVAMMTGGGKKKKYDWMSAGNSGAKNSMGDVSLRFREAREEPGIVVRDLLNSLEKKRIGVEKTLAKGYAKLKD